MADGRPAPGAPAAGQGGFQHPPVGGSASKPPTSDVATDPLFNWYADTQPEPVLISTPRDEGQVEQEGVAAAEAVQQNVQEVRQNFIKQEFNANLFFAQLGGQQGMPANLPPAAPQGMQVDGSGQEVKPPPPKATTPQPSDSGVFTPQRQPDQRPPGGGSAPAPTPVDAEMKREEPDKKRPAEGQGDAARPPRVPQERLGSQSPRTFR